MKIGFIGLGNMGAPMVNNLANAGHQITGFDVSSAALSNAKNYDIVIAKNIKAAASDQDVIITMLPDGKALTSVTKEIIPFMKRDSCLIDCSTVDVQSARMVAKMLNEENLFVLDAPVSGGVVGAKAGTLTFMVGGNDASFSIGEPLFGIMGKRTIHCGPDGAGQAAKICNNMILGASMIATCEAIALADNLSLDRDKLFEVVSTSSGNCWSMSTYCPAPGIGPDSPSDHNYKPGFAAELMLKDLGLSQQAATETGTPTKIGRLAHDIYSDFIKNNNGANLDFSAILTLLEKSQHFDKKDI